MAGELPDSIPSNAHMNSIPEFDGNNHSADQWLRRVDLVGNVYQWTSEQRLAIARCRLTGNAGDWDCATGEDNETWAQFKQAFTQRFALNKRQLRKKLRDCRRRPSESIHTFCDRYRAICNQLDLDQTTDAMMYHFMEALQHEELYKQVGTRFPLNLAEAVDYACQMADVLNLDRGNTVISTPKYQRDYDIRLPHIGDQARPHRETRDSRDNRDQHRSQEPKQRTYVPANPSPPPTRQPPVPTPTRIPSVSVEDLSRDLARLTLAFKQAGMDITSAINTYDNNEYEHEYRHHQPYHDYVNLWEHAQPDDDEAYYNDRGVFIKRVGDFDTTARLPLKRVAVDPNAMPRRPVPAARTTCPTPTATLPPTTAAPSTLYPPAEPTQTEVRRPYRATHNPSEPTHRAAMRLPNPAEEERKLAEDAVRKFENTQVTLGATLRLNPINVYKHMSKALADKSTQARQHTINDQRQTIDATAPMDVETHAALNNSIGLQDENNAVFKTKTPSLKIPRYTICRALVSLNGYPAEAVIDSGASNTVVSRYFLRRLGLDRLILPSTMTFWNADGVKSTASGLIRNLDVGIEDYFMPVDAYVTEARTYELILGGDYLGPAKAVIDYNQRVLSIQDYNDKLINVEIHIGGPNQDAVNMVSMPVLQLMDFHPPADIVPISDIGAACRDFIVDNTNPEPSMGIDSEKQANCMIDNAGDIQHIEASENGSGPGLTPSPPSPVLLPPTEATPSGQLSDAPPMPTPAEELQPSATLPTSSEDEAFLNMPDIIPPAIELDKSVEGDTKDVSDVPLDVDMDAIGGVTCKVNDWCARTPPSQNAEEEATPTPKACVITPKSKLSIVTVVLLLLSFSFCSTYCFSATIRTATTAMMDAPVIFPIVTIIQWLPYWTLVDLIKSVWRTPPQINLSGYPISLNTPWSAYINVNESQPTPAGSHAAMPNQRAGQHVRGRKDWTSVDACVDVPHPAYSTQRFVGTRGLACDGISSVPCHVF